MHLWIFSLRLTSPWKFCIFVLHFSAWPFLGLVSEADFTTICLHPPSGAADIWTLGCFVLQGIFQNIGYLLALDSHPCPIWTVSWGIRSVLVFKFDGSISPTYEGVPKWSGELAIISARSGFPDPTILLVVSAIVSGFLFFQHILSGSSCGMFLSLSFLFYWVVS